MPGWTRATGGGTDRWTVDVSSWQIEATHVAATGCLLRDSGGSGRRRGNFFSDGRDETFPGHVADDGGGVQVSASLT